MFKVGDIVCVRMVPYSSVLSEEALYVIDYSTSRGTWFHLLKLPTLERAGAVDGEYLELAESEPA
jgi:hypothetical protein